MPFGKIPPENFANIAILNLAYISANLMFVRLHN